MGRDIRTRSVKNGFVAAPQQQKESNGQNDAIKKQENDSIEPSFFVIFGVCEYVGLLLHDLKRVLLCIGVLQVRLIPKSREMFAN
jgi:hypothetical protein